MARLQRTDAPRRARRPMAAVSLLAVTVALGAAQAGSVGTASDGRLVDGWRLPLDGPRARFRFLPRVAQRGTHFATKEMAALLLRVGGAVSEVHGGERLVLGDGSASEGGELTRHASHESGRDVDVLFYALGADGSPAAPDRFVGFDREGRCKAAGCTLRFDDTRNWELVRTFVASRHPAVQWLFVSAPLRARLLAHAEANGEHPTLLARARKVLRQPSDSAAHDDHFHVRIFCTAEDTRRGCRDTGPRWPWVDQTGRAEPLTRAPAPPPEAAKTP